MWESFYGYAKHNSENYEGNEITYVDERGDEIYSSYKILSLAHITGGFDGWVVLKSLEKEIRDIKIKKAARTMISLSVCCGVRIANTVKVPQYVVFTGTKSHIKGSLDKIAREYNLQTESPKGEINHSDITKIIYKEFRRILKPYLNSDTLCLAFLYARHSMETQELGELHKERLFNSSLFRMEMLCKTQ